MENNAIIASVMVSHAGVWPSGKATDFESLATPPRQDSDMIESLPRIATVVDWLFAPDLLTIEEACFLSGWDRDTMLFIVNDGGVDLDDDGLIFKDSLEEYREALLDVLNFAPSNA